MRLSTRTRYGTRAMLDLALNYDEGVVSAREIAARQQLSTKYLQHLMASLRCAGLVRTVRGARGGHTLARHPAEINLREIYNVFEGSEALVECVTSPDVCDMTDYCGTREIWAEMDTACMEVLESTTLEDLTHRAANRERASATT